MTEEVRAWALSVCCVCVMGALLAMLFPSGSAKKIMSLILSMLVLSVVCRPLLSLGEWLTEWEYRRTPAVWENPALEQSVESSAKRVYAAFLEENLRRALDGAGISYESVAVDMDNSDDGSICIKQVEVIAKNTDEAAGERIKQLLTPYVGSDVKITLRK